MDWHDRDLYLLFTPSLCALDPWVTLRECLAAGVGLVQWRTPTVDHTALERCAQECHRHRVPLIVNNDVEAAAANLMVAGAHIGQDDMRPDLARAAIRDSQVLGISSHDLGQARRAVEAGADCLGIGPCYATSTKGYTEGIPTSTLAQVFTDIEVPTYAIGGITAQRLTELRELGCQRVAVSQAILSATQPGREVERFLRGLRG